MRNGFDIQAAQDQSRIKALDKIEKIELPKRRVVVKFDFREPPRSGDQVAVRVNCLDGVDPQELVDAPVKYFNMRHDDIKTPPAETRHL